MGKKIPDQIISQLVCQAIDYLQNLCIDVCQLWLFSQCMRKQRLAFINDVCSHHASGMKLQM